MSLQELESLMGEVAKSFEGRPLNGAMAEYLNATYPVGGDAFERLATFCRMGQ